MMSIILPSILIKDFGKLIDNIRVKFSNIELDKSTFRLIFDSSNQSITLKVLPNGCTEPYCILLR